MCAKGKNLELLQNTTIPNKTTCFSISLSVSIPFKLTMYHLFLFLFIIWYLSLSLRKFFIFPLFHVHIFIPTNVSISLFFLYWSPVYLVPIFQSLFLFSKNTFSYLFSSTNILFNFCLFILSFFFTFTFFFFISQISSRHVEEGPERPDCTVGERYVQTPRTLKMPTPVKVFSFKFFCFKLCIEIQPNQVIKNISKQAKFVFFITGFI